MGVAIPTVLAGPGSKFTANVIICQGHPMGSFLLSSEDVTTTVGRDKGESRKGNEKRRLGGFCRPRKGKKKGKEGKKKRICVFRTTGISLADLKLREWVWKPAKPTSVPWSRQTTESVAVWNGDGGISGPWSTRGWEPAGLPVLPLPGAGG